MAIVVVIVVIIIVALLVHSCQVSARNSALQDYTNNVSSLIQQSDGNGRQLFTELAQAGGSGQHQRSRTRSTRSGTPRTSVYAKAQQA